MFAGSSPITFTLPSSEARQKSGSFAPLTLPNLNARTTLSDSRHGRCLPQTWRTLPSPVTGLPRLPEPPFRRAVPTTPADRAGARVDCFPACAAFPKWQEGRHPPCHFRGLRRLHSRYGPPDRSATQGDLCHEAPAQPVTRPSRSPASGPIGRVDDWRGCQRNWGVAVVRHSRCLNPLLLLRFQSPLVAPYVQISRIRRSDRASRFRPRKAAPR